MSRLFTSREIASAPSANLIDPRRGGQAGGGDAAAAPAIDGAGKEYIELLLKMIPGEVVTLYTFIVKLAPLVVLPSSGSSPNATTATAMAASTEAAKATADKHFTPLQLGLIWFAFCLGTVLTYFALKMQEPKPAQDNQRVKAWRWRLGLATGAFPIWAYATTGDSLNPVPYNPALALIITAVYAVTAGLIAKGVSPKRS